MGETLGVSHGAPRGLVNALVPGWMPGWCTGGHCCLMVLGRISIIVVVVILPQQWQCYRHEDR